MQVYATILFWASPVFLLLVLFEKYLLVKIKKESFRLEDTVASLSSGITNVVKDTMGLGITIISYQFLYENLALQVISTQWINYLICFICIDFAGYWSHRLSHEYSFFWNKHLIHHSSEEFNLACALRQSISNLIAFFTIFLLPAALLGVPPQIIAIVSPIHLFMQFWYHTQLIDKMGFLEKILVTPSHHRVHHAINPIYLDKNHSQIFIIWDKIFGTFQEELATEKPIFGITQPVRTWNPFKINFMQWWMMAKDIYHTQTIGNKINVLFSKTGWRPADVSKTIVYSKVTDLQQYNKYDTEHFQIPKYLILSEFLVGFITQTTLFYLMSIGQNNFNLPLAIVVMVHIYCYTNLMDGQNNAFSIAIFRCILIGILGFIYFSKMDNIPSILFFILLIYSILSCFFYETAISNPPFSSYLKLTSDELH